MRTLIMATNNAHKLREVRQILGEEYEVKGLGDIGCEEDIPETGSSFEENASQKARYVYEHYGVDCFADDSGLEVDALGGQPGIFTARYAAINGYGDGHDSMANIRLLLKNMEGETNRRARFRTVISLIEGGRERLFEGVVEGNITTELRGIDGFGYDPVFIPLGTELTFAEMGPAEKNSISHRARAVEAMVREIRLPYEQ